MPSFTQSFTLAALAVASLAAAVPAAVHSHCSNAKLVHSATIDVGGKKVVYSSHSCEANAPATHAIARRERWGFQPCTIFGTCAASPRGTKPSRNVCGVQCKTSCNNVTGILPPTSEDCGTIEDAITIFENKQPPTFVVDPDHINTLTFKTCSYFFQNDGSEPLESCWTDLRADGSAAGDACFPPVQPFSPEGLCSASDGTWSIGASHS